MFVEGRCDKEGAFITYIILRIFLMLTGTHTLKLRHVGAQYISHRWTGGNSRTKIQGPKNKRQKAKPKIQDPKDKGRKVRHKGTRHKEQGTRRKSPSDRFIRAGKSQKTRKKIHESRRKIRTRQNILVIK